MVIPKPLRDHLGLMGEVEVTADGNALRVEAVTGSGLKRKGDRLVIPSQGVTLTVDDVRELRHADQR